jgi:hypothetical protein
VYVVNDRHWNGWRDNVSNDKILWSVMFNVGVHHREENREDERRLGKIRGINAYVAVY